MSTMAMIMLYYIMYKLWVYDQTLELDTVLFNFQDYIYLFITVICR